VGKLLWAVISDIDIDMKHYEQMISRHIFCLPYMQKLHVWWGPMNMVLTGFRVIRVLQKQKLSDREIIYYTANETPRRIVGIFDITPICRRICRQYTSNSPKFNGLPILTV